MTVLLTAQEADGLHLGVNRLTRSGFVSPCEPCPNEGCNGTGYITWEVIGRSGDVEQRSMECPECFGTACLIVSLFRPCDDCTTLHCSICDAGIVSHRVPVGRGAITAIEPEDGGRNFRITLDVVELAA